MSEIDHLVTRIPTAKEDKARRIIELTRMGHSEYQPWAQKALKAQRYYAGYQWDDISLAQQRRRLRLTDNVIADDIDKRVARLEEAQPIMETHGRGSEDFQMGTVWKDLLDWADNWTGERHDSVREVRRRCWQSAHVIGDSFEWLTWDQNEENGLGMAISEEVAAFNVVWDDECKSVQLRDARWLTRFDPVDIEMLEQEFPTFKGMFKSNVPTMFTQGFDQARGVNYQAQTSGVHGSTPLSTAQVAKAYRMEFWEKRPKKTMRYTLDGMVAITRDAEGNVIPLGEEQFDKMKTAQKKRYEEVPIEDYELWKSICVNEHVVSEELSDLDTTKGGHGHYPLARYCAIASPDETHARGEVEPLMGYQDVMNQTMSYGLERMFLDSSSILAIQKGAQPKTEEAKLDRIGEVALQKFFYYPGQEIPQSVQLGSPQGAQLFQNMHTYLSERKDRRSAITDVHRAAPQYDMSGKAIRALMAEADLSTLKIKRGIESGLRQATMIRIGLLQQNMRASRMIRISSKAGSADYQLFLTQNAKQTVEAQKLKKPAEMEGIGDDEFETGEGEKARVLELNDKGVLKFDLRLSLDTGKERNREERMELVTQVLNYLGPAAGVETAIWAVQMMDVPNQEQLAEAMRNEDAKSKMVAQIDQIEKQAGMPLQQLAALAQQLKAGGAPGGPGGPGVPPGAPPPGQALTQPPGAPAPGA